MLDHGIHDQSFINLLSELNPDLLPGISISGKCDVLNHLGVLFRASATDGILARYSDTARLAATLGFCPLCRKGLYNLIASSGES